MCRESLRLKLLPYKNACKNDHKQLTPLCPPPIKSNYRYFKHSKTPFTSRSP